MFPFFLFSFFFSISSDKANTNTEKTTKSFKFKKQTGKQSNIYRFSFQRYRAK